MTTIQLDAIDKQTGGHPLWDARGKAINAYAGLETSLCTLMGALIGTTPDVAAVIFYKIVNTGARNEILNKLMKKRHGDTYRVWWSSFMKAVGQLTNVRNEIVHWHSRVDVYANEGGSFVTDLRLGPPNFWDSDTNTPMHSIETMRDFIVKCDYAERTCNIFHLALYVSGAEARRAEFLSEFTFPSSGAI